MFVWMLVVAALSTRPSCQANFLSQTSENISQTSTGQVCPDSPKDLAWIEDVNLTQYKREPHLKRLKKHKRALDQSSAEDSGSLGSFDWRLEKVYEYPLLLPSISVQNALSNLGDTRRLERVLFKLLSGQPVQIVALGGSVTVGHGPEKKQNAWLYRLFTWLNETFPHPEHRFTNQALPAVTSAYVAPCVDNMVPSDTDLVFLEFTFNDAERTKSNNMDEPTRLGLERLLRKLLRMGNKPAVVNLHYHPFNVFQHYWDGGQDRMELLFKYYAVTSLSTRGALHRLLADEAWLLPKMWFEKDVHPSCVGSKYIADVMIGFLQDMLAYMLQTFLSQERLPHADVLLDQLPAPLFEGNTADQLEKCILDDDFKNLVFGNQGFQWLDEGRHPGQHKLGFISFSPGENLVLKVPLVEFLPLMHEDRRLLVGVGVLMSYEHSGWVHIDCVNGCSCQRREVNTHHPIRYSLNYWKGLNVTVDKGSENCELYIVNVDKSTSGEHKVKLTSMLVSLELTSFIESWKFEF